jgi:cell division protein FtsQ
MDGGGRLDQPLMRSGPSGVEQAGTSSDAPARAHVGSTPRRRRFGRPVWLAAYGRLIERWSNRLIRLPPPRGVGIAGSILLLAGSLSYGVVEGQHVTEMVHWFKDGRDSIANSLGFRIAAISLTGSKEVSRQEILATVGVTGRASLLFLDADTARARLLTNPWIADAAVLKLYPDRLQITVKERQAFALWQKDGQVSVIADDGTVLEPFVEDRFLGLPLVVGRGAQLGAKDFLALVDQHPNLRAQVRASILVAQRRWDLRLSNGINVQLPETDAGRALDELVTLDRDKKLLSRDITNVDLRLADRVTVRLSPAAAQSRNESLQTNKKKKGGDA